MSEDSSNSFPSLCPVLAIAPNREVFRDGCPTQHNLAVASTQVGVLISAIRAVTALATEARAITVRPEELADLLEIVREHAETVQTLLDAVSSQAS